MTSPGCRWFDASDVRRYIGGIMLGAPPVVRRLGEIRLLPHQKDAVRRIEPALAEFGGVLLADPVGLGKTYVGLHFASKAEQALIVAPAALRFTWELAIERTGVAATFETMESLSRGRCAVDRPDTVIVDEAHHFRTPTTRRYGELARLCSGARVLLLSATPVHNSRRDLESLLALFIGSRARDLDEAALGRIVIRRSEHVANLPSALPPLHALRWLRPAAEDDLLEQVVALPAAVPPSDGGDAGVLAVWSLVRQWASSRSALTRALRRRVALAVAMEALLEEGRMPSSRELRAWRLADDSVQLALPALIGQTEASCTTRMTLLGAVSRHREALEALLAAMRHSPDPDDTRARLLRSVRNEHRGERIIAFSEFEATVFAMFRQLAPEGSVAMLTARGARISSGELRRREVLDRFAPHASGARPAAAADDVTLLLATELLSEGVNLQDASVVVHLDLPWNPARLEQRVGRVRRIGSTRPVHVYAMAPPAAAERLLEVERRLREKMASAGASVGLDGSVLPMLFGSPGLERVASAAEHSSRIGALMHEWSEADGRIISPLDTLFGMLTCAVESPMSGFIAMVRERDHPMLVASLGGPATTDPRVVAEAAAIAGGASTSAHRDPGAEGAGPLVDPAPLRIAECAIEAWLLQRRLHEAVRGDSAQLAQLRRGLLRRIAAEERAFPHHTRAAHAELVARARCAALLPMGVHLERALEVMVSSPTGGAEWLRGVAAVGCGDRELPPTGTADTGHQVRVAAIVLLVPPRFTPPACPAAATPS